MHFFCHNLLKITVVITPVWLCVKRERFSLFLKPILKYSLPSLSTKGILETRGWQSYAMFPHFNKKKSLWLSSQNFDFFFSYPWAQYCSIGLGLGLGCIYLLCFIRSCFHVISHVSMCSCPYASCVLWSHTSARWIGPTGDKQSSWNMWMLDLQEHFYAFVFTKTGWMGLQRAWRPSIFWAAEHNNKAKATHAETKDDGTQEDMPDTIAPQSRCKARIFFFPAFLKNTGLFFISHLTMSIKVSRSHRGGLWEFNITRGSGFTYRSPVEIYPFLSTREEEEM